MSRDALVVGINAYSHLPRLSAPAQDAEAIAQLLLQYGDFQVRRLPEVVSNQQIQVGTATAVTQEQLEDGLEQLFYPDGQNVPDTALFYFSGHGLRRSDRRIKEGFLATSDVNPAARGWGLSLQWLRRLLQESPVRQQIVILDCCHSGELMNFMEADPGDRAQARDRCFIAAAREFEAAYEDIHHPHSVITQIILNGLDPARSPKQWITNYSLVDFMTQELQAATQRPVFNNAGAAIRLTHYHLPAQSGGQGEAQRVEPAPIPSNLPHSGAVEFVGRTDELAGLHQMLHQPGAIAPRAAIQGMGGVGKTELALRYALTHRNQYPGGLCWLSVRGADLGKQIVRFATIQLQLNVPDNLLESDQIAYCWRHWNAGDALLIYDDGISYQDLKPYLPPPDPRFKVLITSRQLLAKSVPQLSLDVLHETAALNLLESLIGYQRLKAELAPAQALCQWLGYLPLALELVGRYLLGEPDLLLLDMQERLQRKRLDARAMLSAEDDMTAKLGVAAAFELSWAELPLLTQGVAILLSLFAATQIPWGLVKSCVQEQDLEALEALEVARSQLVKLHLLQRVKRDVYDLHPLVREFLRAKQTQFESTEYLKCKVAHGVVAIAQHIPETLTQKDLQRLIVELPHIIECEQYLPLLLQEDTDGSAVAMAYQKIGLLHLMLNRFTAAEQALKQALALWETISGSDSVGVAAVLTPLAALNRDIGALDEAEAYARTALALRERHLGVDHLAVLDSVMTLGTIYFVRGRTSEAGQTFLQDAEQFFLRVLAARERLVNQQDHPHIAESLNNLGVLYENLGDMPKAQIYHMQAVALNQRLLGDNHPHTASSYNNLGKVHLAQGNAVEALQLFEKAKIIFAQLGWPQAWWCYHNIALVHEQQGNIKQAITVAQESYRQLKENWSDDHPLAQKCYKTLERITKFQAKAE